MVQFNTLRGAVGNGIYDNTEIINDALEMAHQQGRGLLIPPGVFAYSALLNSNGVYVRGQFGAELHALNLAECAFVLTGVGGAVEGLRLTCVPVTERGGGWKANRIVVTEGAEDWLVARNEVASGNGTGLYISVDACNGVIRGNYIHDTLADSVHMTERVHHIQVIGNRMRRSGDDCVAVVSYRKHDGMVHHIEAWGNDIRDNVWGRGMTVVGGSDVNYHHNFVDNNVQSAGIYLHQEENYETFGCTDVHVWRNNVRNCGNLEKGHYAVSASGSAAWPNKRITIERNVVVIDDTRSGIDIRANCLDSRALQNVIQVAGGKAMRLATGVVFEPYIDGPVGM